MIIVRDPDEDLSVEPDEITASRAILAAAADRISESDITLPDEAWARMVQRYDVEQSTDLAASCERASAGDTTATLLYRVFKRDWETGGRLYGGWWINLPKVERAHLRIAGEPVVELDYARLHPTLLFAKVGQRLDFDPYVVPGLESLELRALGKRTFNRLINKVSPASGLKPWLSAKADDRASLPEDLSFRDYLQRFVERLAPIADFFGSSAGLRLQREDSDLAIGVLDRLEARALPVLPVHDSFITLRQNEADLRAAMVETFSGRYGFEPTLR